VHRRRLAGDDENTRTDHGADAEENQVLRGEDALEARIAMRASIDVLTSIDVRRGLNGMRREQVFKHVSPLLPEVLFIIGTAVAAMMERRSPVSRHGTIAQRGTAVQAALRGLPRPCTEGGRCHHD
jgi:hypothetical protein